MLEKTCRHCGEKFVTYNAKQTYCSKRCANRGHETRRYHKVRGNFVAHVDKGEIILRDGGVCQICGKKVNLKVEAPHPLSASLDHIIPLSKGGTHEPKNVQLAHFRCNSLKSNRIENIQLRLL